MTFHSGEVCDVVPPPDANASLITANNTYYAIDQVPEFWEWIAHQGAKGRIKMPLEIIEEVKAGRKEKDLLIDWIKDDGNHDALLLKEDVDPVLIQDVVNKRYASDLTDDEIEQLGRDPFLVAYAFEGVGVVGLTVAVVPLRPSPSGLDGAEQGVEVVATGIVGQRSLGR